MIDTIILSIPKYLVKNRNGTEKLGWDAQSNNTQSGYAKWVRNPSKLEKETGKYYPKLTGYKRFSDYFVKLEFSIPKLIYYNNLDEVEDINFEKIIKILYARLYEMDVKINTDVLSNANVSAIHYSKNIELHNGYTADYIIRELKKTNKRKSFDNTTFRYSNDGHSFQMYTKAHSFVIYDKIADIHKTLKRSTDRDITDYQQSLFSQLNNKKEILRLEVRLSETRKMKNVLEEIGYKDEYVFSKLFSKEISKKVINKYWNVLMKDARICFLPINSPKHILELICIKYPKMKHLKKLQMGMLCLLASDEGGIPETRQILMKGNDYRGWNNLIKDYKELSENIGSVKSREWIEIIEEAITNFNTYHIEPKPP